MAVSGKVGNFGLFLALVLSSHCGRQAQSDEGFAAYPDSGYNGTETNSGTKAGGAANGISGVAADPGTFTPQNSAINNSTAINSGEEPGIDTHVVTPPPGTCGGLNSLNACWYLAAEEQSCNDKCEDHYGYDDRTDSLVGSLGSDHQCKQIAAALAGPIDKGIGQELLDQLKNQFLPFLKGLDIASSYKFGSKDVAKDFAGNDEDLQFAYSPGCTVHKGPKGDYALIVRHYGVRTNPEDGAFGTQRVCACKG